MEDGEEEGIGRWGHENLKIEKQMKLERWGCRDEERDALVIPSTKTNVLSYLSVVTHQ